MSVSIAASHTYSTFEYLPVTVGSLDPYLAGSIALYNVCDLDNAYLFDHAKGHTLPRDKHTVKELGDIIRNMVANI